MGVRRPEDKPTSIGDEPNQVGQMTSHTETERDVLTDGYSGGEILVTEEEAVMRSMRAHRRGVIDEKDVSGENTTGRQTDQQKTSLTA